MRLLVMRDEYDIQCLNPRRAPYAGELKKADGDGWTTWDDVRDKLFTPEEVAASDSRVALIGELIKARRGKGAAEILTLQEAIKEALQDPVFRAECEDLKNDPELQALRNIIDGPDHPAGQ